MAELERLARIASTPGDGGIGGDAEWAVREIERLRAVLTAAQEYFAAYNAADKVMREGKWPALFPAHADTNAAFLKLRDAVRAAGGEGAG